MLVLTRKLGEAIVIGDDIKISILQVKGRQVRIGVDAPRETRVHREEVLSRIQKAVNEEKRAMKNSEENQLDREEKTGTE